MTIVDSGRNNESLPQVRDVLAKPGLMSKGDVIEQYQMLMDLPHVADVRNYRQTKLASQQTDRQKFRNACNARAIHLHEPHRASLHEILENNSIGDVLT